MIKETDNFKTATLGILSGRASCRWPRRVKIYITYEKLHDRKRILSFQRFAGITFSIMNTSFEGSQDLFSKLYKMYQSLEILLFALT